MPGCRAASLSLLAGLGGCVLSGVARNDACQPFAAGCTGDGDCCSPLVCAEAGVCAYGPGTTGGPGPGTGSGSGSSAGSGSGSESSTGSSGAGSGSSGSTSGGSSGFQTAAHQMPTIPNQSGTVFASPVLAVISYADDPNRSAEEGFAAFLVQSSWLGTVGSEYGVGLGSIQKIELTGNAPASVDDSGVQSAITQILSGGGTGTPPGSTVFMIFFPAATVVSANGQALCSFASGYHAEGQASGSGFAYAVIPDCGGGKAGELTAIEEAISHEFIEAATDPFPSDSPGWVISDTTNPWHALGGEVADLCADVLPQWTEGGYGRIARVYSNRSAQAGGDPCLPAAGTYFATDVEPSQVAEVAAGAQTTFQVTGWSTAAVAPWELQAVLYGGTFTPSLSLSATAIGNGGSATLTVGVPAGRPSGDYAVVQLGSVDPSNDQSSTFVGVAVP
ncbi:MAG: hypothetical protein ACYDCL_16440 [Myxococcales bacterium]